ncbi:MAG: hypothetical protein K2N18_04500, partial [Clostridia bacterium]|nr:hypothetical protein [Clostridia bacterium]
MKTKFKVFSVIICVLLSAVSLTACSNAYGGKLLGKPKPLDKVDYSELSKDDYTTFKNSVEKFAAAFSASAYSEYDEEDNFAVSPISVYMALALSAECASGDTRQEILDALGVNYQQLKTHFSTLYRSLVKEYKAGDKTTGLLNITNSIWVDEETTVKQPCIDTLSDDYFAYSYSADFKYNNAKANKAVSDFVKKETHGLIDKDFELSERTMFALINTLYLKTIWNTNGKDLPFAKDKYNFTAKDGSVKETNLLQGSYNGGRVQEFDTFSTFYTKTYDGYKIKFILPKAGNTIDSVFSAENISKVNSITDYGSYNEAGRVNYLTRVLFPEYKCAYDGDIVDILKDKFDIDLFFKDPTWYSPACDFSTLFVEPCYCKQLQHVTKLTVDRTGIEGAAVTVGPPSSDGMTETLMHDFIVNRAFG